MLTLVCCLLPVRAEKVFDIDSLNCRIFLPDSDKATGRAVVICPGGAYMMHAYNHEGYDWAPFFNNSGIAVAVVRYTLPSGDRNLPIGNIRKVMKELKSNASKWKINPEDIGIMGFSAGGHLASTIATHYDADSRPAFQILFYPVISMQAPLTHEASHDYFLGKNPDKATEELYSNQKQVTESTPRAIIFFSSDDNAVPVENGLEYYNALRGKGVEASIHIYPTGGHGWGYNRDFKYHLQVVDELAGFINQ